jgi:hypothetical protein
LEWFVFTDLGISLLVAILVMGSVWGLYYAVLRLDFKPH